jgi:hypothetical protein
MRDRAWRRYIEEKVTTDRLRLLVTKSHNWWRFYTVNGSKTGHPTIIDHLGSKEYFNAKTITTESWTSKHKVKYSPNKNKTYYRDQGRYKGTREYNKKYLLKVLRENGLK